jgi:glycosyltransferase involved in cell wall biosynthesis
VASTPVVSVIVCTRNRGARLRACLDAISRMTSTELWELILVDNGSTDTTAAVIEQSLSGCRQHVEVLEEATPGLARSRNRGIAAARGSIVAFTDDDCYPAPDWLDQLVSVFGADGRIGYVGGRVLLHDRTDDPVTTATSRDTLRMHPLDFVPAGVIHGANMAFRAGVFSKAGGFDVLLGAGTALCSGEDFDMVNRSSAAGYAGIYDPRPMVYHHHGRKPGAHVDLLYRGYGYGRGAVYAKCVLCAELRGVRRGALRHWTRTLRWNLRSRALRHHVFEVVGAMRYLALRARARREGGAGGA